MINYPIDYVFPCVDCTKPQWVETYKAYCRKVGNIERIKQANGARYRDWGFLQFVFRSIEKNLPFIRRVYLLVQDSTQVPVWVNTDEVKVVTHGEFMPDRYLPTYNSTAIEMCLDNLPDLAEHFIYANDDMYLLGKMTAEDYFTEDGKVKIYFKNHGQPTNMFQQQCNQSFNVLNIEFGNGKWLPHYMVPKHGVTPMIKSHIQLIKQRIGKHIDQSVSNFRQNKNLNQYIWADYEYLTNNYEQPTRTFGYCGMAKKPQEAAQMISSGKYQEFCLNDGENILLNQWIKDTSVRKAFLTLFPEKSKYELPYKVTVGICGENAGSWIEQCVKSIPQRDDVEIIYVDDCSTDNSVEILKQYNVKTIINKERKGFAYSRNQILNQAKGEYLLFLNEGQCVDTAAFNNIVDKELNTYDIVRCDTQNPFITFENCFVAKNYIGEIRYNHLLTSDEDADFKMRVLSVHPRKQEKILQGILCNSIK